MIKKFVALAFVVAFVLYALNWNAIATKLSPSPAEVPSGKVTLQQQKPNYQLNPDGDPATAKLIKAAENAEVPNPGLYGQK